MSDLIWKRVSFQDFIDKYDKSIILESAPLIMHSKKDKEHEAFKSLVAFLFIAGFGLIYTAISIFVSPVYFSPFIFYTIICITIAFAALFLYNFIKSDVNIRLIECWFEIHETTPNQYYCFTFYPIFTGKCLPNKAKNMIYKLYQEEILKSKVDIAQIEVYAKVNSENLDHIESIGFYFQYGEGMTFKDERVDRNCWKFFPINIYEQENYLATANWDHQFEWRHDLELDYDKLHDYAPWILHKWNEDNLKPLTESYKQSINWELRRVESLPKLQIWNRSPQNQSYESFKAYKDLQIVNEIIEKFFGSGVELKNYGDIKKKIPAIKAYFRDQKS
jgi:hypothetical protein